MTPRTTLRIALRIACPIAAVATIVLGIAALAQHFYGFALINAGLALINVALTVINWRGS